MELINYRVESDISALLSANGATLFIVYVGIFTIAYWLVRLRHGESTAKRISKTGAYGAVGLLTGMLTVSLPLILFSEFLYPVSGEDFNTIARMGAAAGWGWFAHIAWSEHVV